MARNKKRPSDRAAKRHKKALKRASKLKARQAPSEPTSSELDATMRALVDMLSGIPHAPPAWACAASYTEPAARHVADHGTLPGRPLAPPHHRAKLAAWLAVDLPWGLAHVRRCTDAELVGKLGSLGLPLTPAKLRQLAVGHRSAWAMGELLIDQPVTPAHLPGAITTELWRRWLPDIPCYEGVCDQIQQGYALHEQTGEHPLEIWMAAWRTLEALLPPRITSFAAADHETGCLQNLANWVADMVDPVHNGARLDEHFAHEALGFIRWVQRFDDLPAATFADDEAYILAFGGRQAEAIALLEAAIAHDPLGPMPYAVLSDLLTIKHPHCTRDPARAAAILRTAISQPLRDAEHWDLQRRLDWTESEAATE